MREFTNTRETGTMEVITWLSNHPRIKRKLCWDGYETEPRECLEIMELIQEQGFYEMIYVLLLKNQHNIVIAEAIEKLVADAWVSEYEQIGNKKMYNAIKECIENEIRLREMKK